MLRNIVILIFWFFATAVNAAAVTSGTYQFFDHPDSALYVSGQTGPYGLRLDTLLNPYRTGPTFSVNQNGASVFMHWDG